MRDEDVHFSPAVLAIGTARERVFAAFGHPNASRTTDAGTIEDVYAFGTVVFGGMLASTLLAIPFVPVFYIAVQRASRFRGRKAVATSAASAPATTTE
jgi:hypothetical protein